MRRHAAPLTAVLLAILGGPPASGQASTEAQRPNVVLVIADDMGWGDLSGHGARDLETPNIDALAQQSVRLTQFYANGPLCRPTRAALMTGRYPHRARFEGNDDPLRDHAIGLPNTELALPRMLERAGYSTALVGKWHLGTEPTYHPNAHGFQQFFGVLRSGIDYYTHRNPDGQLDLWDNEKSIEREGHLTGILTQRAVETIEKADGPFFVEVAYNAACPPFQAPGRPEADRAPRVTRQEYCAMVEEVDRGIGRILGAIEQRGIADNTLVIYTHDHGGEGLSRNEPFAHGIGTLWEGGIRVPCFVRWPSQLPAGTTIDQVAATMDLTATVLAAAGTSPAAERKLDGIDLLPFLRGDRPPVERTLFWRVRTRSNYHRAVRHGDTKLLVSGSEQKLFDLSSDPGEQRDLSRERPGERRELRALLGAWEQELVSKARDAIPGERASLDELLRTLPDDDPRVQQGRLNLASTQQVAGRVFEAMTLEEDFLRACAGSERTNSFERALQSRLARKKTAVGDWAGALALEEAAYATEAAVMAAGDSNLQQYGLRLATLRHDLGKLQGALELRLAVYAQRATYVPAINPNQQSLSLLIAGTHLALGNAASAARLEQQVYNQRLDKLDRDEPKLQASRQSTARALYQLGDWRAALTLQREYLDVLSTKAPPDHPLVLGARQSLAATLHRLGETEEARQLLDEVVTARARYLPGDHPELQQARLSLLATELELGEDGDKTVAAYLRGWRETLLMTPAADLAERLRQLRHPFDLCLSSATSEVSPPASKRLADLLLLIEAVRAAEILGARQTGSDDAKRVDLLRGFHRQRARATVQAVRIANTARRETNHQARLQAVVDLRTAAERRIVAQRRKTAATPWGALSGGDLAPHLPERSAAASVVTFAHGTERRVAAVILQRDGTVTSVPLGAANRMRRLGLEAVRALRENGEATALQELRRVLVEPILARLGDATTLYLSLDRTLPLVPLETLPDDRGRLLGESVQVRVLPSLVVLLPALRPAASSRSDLVAFGGLDHDSIVEDAPSVLFPLAKAMPDTRRTALFADPSPTADEVTASAQLFEKTFPRAKASVVTGADGTKARLAELTAEAGYLHLATANYAAPASIPSAADPREVELVRPEAPRASPGVAPSLLTGLALSGANLPPDIFARRPGIATTQELMALDLRGCKLVVWSGYTERDRVGHGTPRGALHAAGARKVLTSLWQTDAASTRELLADFYRRLWVEEKDAHRALWEARLAAKQRGAPTSGWAGWMLTGL